MRIGIDISQVAYSKTGVANYVRQLVKHLLSIDTTNQYILFYSSLRQPFSLSDLNLQPQSNVSLKKYKMPPRLLDLVWNKLHIMPIEKFIGDVDVFISSDWTQPPTTKAKQATILYDLIVYKFPEETDATIVATHKRRLQWVKKECSMIFCISESTKQDAMKLLGIEEDRLRVIYPGI